MDELDIFQRNKRYKFKIGKTRRINDAPMKDLARQRLEILRPDRVGESLRVAYDTFRQINPNHRLPAIVHDHNHDERYIITIGVVKGVSSRWCTACLGKLTSRRICKNTRCDRNPDVIESMAVIRRIESIDGFDADSEESDNEPPKKIRRYTVEDDLSMALGDLCL